MYFLCLSFFLFLKKRKQILHSHWNVLLDGLSYSSQETYKRIEDYLSTKSIKGISFKTAFKSTSHIVSSPRQYLIIDWRDFRYEICAAPFADSFFVSYRMNIRESGGKIFVSRIPFIGWIAEKYFFRVSYYMIDSANMFNSMVHNCIVDIVDEISKEKNVPALTEQQKIPVMDDIFKR